MIAQLTTARPDRTVAESLYQVGYQAGRQRRGMRGSLSHDPDYVNGWGDGYAAWKAQQPPVNLADCGWSESSLTRDLF